MRIWFYKEGTPPETAVRGMASTIYIDKSLRTLTQKEWSIVLDAIRRGPEEALVVVGDSVGPAHGAERLGALGGGGAI